MLWVTDLLLSVTCYKTCVALISVKRCQQCLFTRHLWPRVHPRTRLSYSFTLLFSLHWLDSFYKTVDFVKQLVKSQLLSWAVSFGSVCHKIKSLLQHISEVFGKKHFRFACPKLHKSSVLSADPQFHSTIDKIRVLTESV